MSQKQSATINTDYLNPNKNHELVIKLFNTYYRSHNHTGKIYEELPKYFLVKPEVLMVPDLATRNSDKLILEDCIQRAHARNGYITVSKYFNPKLNYYWLELNVCPYMLGDVVNEQNKSGFYYVLSRFIDFIMVNPKIYGDLKSETDADKDLALMISEIKKLGSALDLALASFPEEVMVSYNAKWPPSEVNKLLNSMKGSEMEWCDLFAESLIYVMGKKS